MNLGLVESRKFDLAVIGGGAAGMWTAICAAEQGASVCLISRKPLAESASFRAQGGLAAALEAGDTPEQHAADTIAAGRGLCVPEAVKVLTEEAPAAVEELLRRGVQFDRGRSGDLSLGLEGGHTRRRIVHSGGSQTGREITARLAEIASDIRGLTLFEQTSALALDVWEGRCYGVITDLGRISARATVLATGGGAALWSRTTNPWGAIGAGPVLAHAAGAELADLEFCQFHPTAIALPGTEFDGTLITEAVRGEGATLLDRDGERFTDELAARDAVTAAILDRMRADGVAHIHLDLRMVDPDRFPNIFATLTRAGIDATRELIPISPASHYMMGGIAVDTDGASSLTGLLSVGESSCNGLHGANRLASNSLSECFVFGRRAAIASLDIEPATPTHEPGKWRFEPPTLETREAVWRLAGPVRRSEDLERLSRDPYPLARAIAVSAQERRESRGGHRRTDYPGIDPNLNGVHLIHRADGSLQPRRWPGT